MEIIKVELEFAITKLKNLLDHSDESAEIDFQKFFECFPVVFRLLGYIDIISQPSLMLEDGKSFIPDFLVQRANKEWSIFELKLPDDEVHLNKEKRNKVTSKMETYVSQVQEYSEYFRDPAKHKITSELYGKEFSANIGAIIVSGRSANIDKKEVSKLFSRYSNNIELYTYDDILEALETNRIQYFSNHENCYGMSIHLNVAFRSGNTSPAYLLDIGTDTKRNRVSIYLKNKDVVLSIYDDSSKNIKLHIPDNEWGFDAYCINYIVVELGVLDDEVYISLSANGRIHKYYNLSDIKFDLDAIYTEELSKIKFHYVIAADMNFINNSAPIVYNMMIYSTLLSFQRKYNLLMWNLKDNDKKCFNGDGSGYVCSVGHPRKK